MTSGVNTHVYGNGMNDRLTKSDWISHGLRTLALEGPGALKAGRMAAKLKVSRGSFYWHFRDLADFESQLLRSWQVNSTDRVIEDLDAREGEPGLAVHLIQQAFRGRRRLDRAMRSWAAADGKVARVVASVDARRITRIAKLLVDAGVERRRAHHRAAFLYWAYLGQAAVMDRDSQSIPPSALADVVRLFELDAPNVLQGQERGDAA
jgi:AcrR family transcriptional regulator